VVLISSSLHGCFSEYFNARHSQLLSNEDRLVYLRQFANKFIQPEDTVITFNYDCLVERVLRQKGIWTIADGYGVTRELRRSDEPVHVDRSQCRVFKMHGSAGWVSSHPAFVDPSFFFIQLDDLTFIGYLGCEDIAFQKVVGERPMQLPTYIKDLNVHPLPIIWRQAADALRKAEKVSFIGYSLPDSDSAAWMLFLSTMTSAQRIVFFWYEKDKQARDRAEVVKRRFHEAGITISPADIQNLDSFQSIQTAG
jgi:hypothetical protein